MVNNWLNSALLRLFPYRCVLCQQPSELSRDLCQTCESLQTHTPATHCTICAIPLDTGADENDRLCGECLRERPAYDQAFIPYIYSDGIRLLVSRLKFRNKLAYADLLAALFCEAAQNRLSPFSLPDVLIPMPLHRRRLRQRGYNQSQLLARLMGKYWGIGIDSHCCRRVLHTLPQADLSRSQRKKNVKGIFSVQADIPYQHVAIVDDVMTTGSSANELARQLKNNGVQRVDVWCIARTVKD